MRRILAAKTIYRRSLNSGLTDFPAIDICQL
jgi:hypothetical protein